MRVVLLSEGFTEQMGYSDTLLGKTLAELGVDVHVVTSDQYLVEYRDFKSLYNNFLGASKPAETRQAFGMTIHTLPSRRYVGREGVYLQGLRALLRNLRPDVVQAMKPNSQCTWQVRAAQRELGYAFFLEEHTHWSVFKLHPQWKKQAYKLLYGKLIGPWLSRGMHKDYCLGSDCRDIAINYYGIPASKAILASQGTDTSTFRPAATEAERTAVAAIRAKAGAQPSDIVVIYTGRLHPGKEPHVLAEAIQQLRREGLPYRGLFVGWGPDAYRAKIEQADGCVVHPFVKWYELADFYRAADIAVWPAQESMSQLDAIATALPLVLHDGVGTPERAEGNGRLFRSGDASDLARVLRELADPALRQQLGQLGRTKAEETYSWRKLAQARLADYEAACAERSPKPTELARP